MLWLFLKSLEIQPFFFNISESAQEARALGGLGGQKDRNLFVRYCIQSVRSLFFGRETSVLVKRRGGGGYHSFQLKTKLLEFADVNT